MENRLWWKTDGDGNWVFFLLFLSTLFYPFIQSLQSHWNFSDATQWRHRIWSPTSSNISAECSNFVLHKFNEFSNKNGKSPRPNRRRRKKSDQNLNLIWMFLWNWIPFRFEASSREPRRNLRQRCDRKKKKPTSFHIFTIMAESIFNVRL